MKKFLLLIIATFIVANTWAQDVQLSEMLMNSYKTAKYNALKKSAKHQDHLWLTPILQKVKQNWNKLTPEAKKLFQAYEDRPSIPNESTYSLGFFVFHYTTTGDASVAVSSTDENQNNVPDYVEKMADIMVNKVAAKDHSELELGLAYPPDDNLGGNVNYDVYLCDAGDGVYGYVAPEDKIGDNNYTNGITEQFSYSSYMVLRNNYDNFENPDVAVSVTIAHEYQHAIQMGYNLEMSTAIKEMCATWAEDYNFNGYGDNLQYLSTLFAKPDVALNITNDEAGEGELNNYWYSSFLFAKYMTERYGSEVIKSMYEKFAQHTESESTNMDIATLSMINDVLIANKDVSFKDVYRDFCIANRLLTNIDTYKPYTYENAQAYKEYAVQKDFSLNIENTISYNGTPVNYSSQTDGNNKLMRVSADYLNIQPTQDFSVMLFNNQAKKITMVLAKINTSNNTVVVVNPSVGSNDQSIDVMDAENYNEFALIVYRVDNCADTISAPYTLSIGAATGISDINLSNIAVYPSPASDNINIEISNSQEISSVELVNLLGAKVFNKKLDANTSRITIPTNNIPSGTYFLKMAKGNETLTKKVVVLH